MAQQASITPLRRQKAAEAISQNLREVIAQGNLQDGDALPSTEVLRQQFGVSAPTLREGLRVLEGEGLITIARGRGGGARVRRPDLTSAARSVAMLLQLEGVSVAEIYDAHEILEVGIVRVVAQQKSRATVRRLEKIIEHQEAHLEDPASVSSVLEFHQVLVESAGNRAVTLAIRLLQDLVSEQVASRVAKRTGGAAALRSRRAVVRDQRKVLDALRARDPDAAVRHWTRYLQRWRKMFLGEIGSEPVQLRRVGT